MLKKNDIITVDIIDMGMEFEGIAKTQDGYVIFIPDGIIGEKVEVKIVKANKNYAYGKILNILKMSKEREKGKCESAKRCGGCDSWHFSYELEKELKRNNIISVLKKQGITNDVEKIIGDGRLNYRNKVQYPVRCENGVNKFGFFAKRSHDIISCNKCFIQNEQIDSVARKVYERLIELEFSAYDENSLKGDIRNIIFRISDLDSTILLTIVVNSERLLKDKRFAEIANIDEKIASVVLNVNDKNTNEILGDKSKVIFGDGKIISKIGDKKYYISSKSFFQVNTYTTKLLYDTLKSNLNLSKNDILFDLYSGVGSIGIYLSDSVKMVYGIEIEEEAVEMANLNLKLNNIDNAEYKAGDVKDKIAQFKERKICPDVIVVDPPRAGLDAKSIEYILDFKPERIGYVSCNPASLARDLKLLSEKYNIQRIIPCDMFPRTKHVECVCILKLR